MKVRLIPFALAICSLNILSAVDYDTEIHPLLKKHCGKCHMDGEAKGKVALDRNKIKNELDGGSIVAGDVKGSDLHWTMTLSPDDDSAMPPKGRRVPKEEIDLIAKWIEEGAKLESTATPAAVPATTPEKPDMMDDTMGGDSMTDTMGGDSMGAEKMEGEPGMAPKPAAPAVKPYKGVFKNHAGKQLTATLVRMDGDRAILVLPDGQEYRYPVAMFDSPTKEIVEKFKSGDLN